MTVDPKEKRVAQTLEEWTRGPYGADYPPSRLLARIDQEIRPRGGRWMRGRPLARLIPLVLAAAISVSLVAVALSALHSRPAAPGPSHQPGATALSPRQTAGNRAETTPVATASPTASSRATVSPVPSQSPRPPVVPPTPQPSVAPLSSCQAARHLGGTPVEGTSCSRAYGQANFAAASAGGGAQGLNDPRGVTSDAAGNIYVADRGNNRVLFFAAGGTTPSRVYGQGGSLSTTTCNGGGISAHSLCGPSSVALDGGGNLYIADEGNNRVLYFPAGATTATRVYGQTNFASNYPGSHTATGLSSPAYVATDHNGNLYVADWVNSRVLFFPSGSTTPTRVYGQFDDLSCTVQDNQGSCTAGDAGDCVTGGHPNANNLCDPASIVVDGGGDVYISDNGNYRVLYYPAGATSPTRIYGDDGSPTLQIDSGDASHFGALAGIALSPAGLYVIDCSRILFFPGTATTATKAYGSAGSFISCGGGAASAVSLNYPEDLSLDEYGDLFIADSRNNRVLMDAGA